jgi:hypothetical protein
VADEAVLNKVRIILKLHFIFKLVESSAFLKQNKKVRIGWPIFATKRTKKRQSCKSPIEDVQANVEV